MRRAGTPDVLALLKAREEATREAFLTVKTAPPLVFGGQTRHRYLAFQAKGLWLSARIALAERTAERNELFLGKDDEQAPGADEQP